MDEDLLYIEEVRGGNKEAFSFFIDKYQKQIYNFVYQFFRDRATSLELTQETFLRAFKFLDTYQNDKKFSVWLFSIAKNLCIDEAKRHPRGATVMMDEGNQTDLMNDDGSYLNINGGVAPDSETLQIQNEEKRTLLEAVKKLSPKYRMVITLCYFDGMSYDEIAEVVEKPVSTVKIRIFRAKKQLLELLGEKL